MRIILLVIFSLWLASCSTTKSTSSDREFINYQFNYSFYVSDLMEVDKVDGSMNPSFLFPTIPGAIFGNPSEDILHVSESNESDTVSLSLPVNVDHKAAFLSQREIQINPADSKILRLGTFHVNPENPDVLAGGGFVNTNTNNLLILVYVSKPSEVTGIVIFDKTEISHKLNFGRSGWHWVESIRLEENNYQLVNFKGNPSSIEFAVLVPRLGSI